MALQPFVVPWPLFQFLDFYTVGSIPWTGDQPVTKPLPAHTIVQTQNKHTQTSIPWVEFEPTIPAFEREKTVHASDPAATVIVICLDRVMKFTNTLTVADVTARTTTKHLVITSLGCYHYTKLFGQCSWCYYINPGTDICGIGLLCLGVVDVLVVEGWCQLSFYFILSCQWIYNF
jgi:hypothetical protein